MNKRSKEYRQIAIAFNEKIKGTPGIVGVYLHGSTVRGEATEKSDIDILIYGDLTDEAKQVIYNLAEGTHIHLFFASIKDVRKGGRPADVVRGRHPSELLTL